MSNIVKSIFRQREIEKLYELRYFGSHLFYRRTDDDVALSAISNDEKIISDKVIGTYDVEIPMLEVGDEFFLHDIQEVVKVKNRMRSSDGSITYYVEDKVLETENTKKTYAECREKLNIINLKRKSLKACKKSWTLAKKNLQSIRKNTDINTDFSIESVKNNPIKQVFKGE